MRIYWQESSFSVSRPRRSEYGAERSASKSIFLAPKIIILKKLLFNDGFNLPGTEGQIYRVLGFGREFDTITNVAAESNCSRIDSGFYWRGVNVSSRPGNYREMGKYF